MNIRFNGFCKIISTILIATFLSYNISWANPDMNLATSGMAGSLFEEDGEISKIKWFVELALRDNKAYEASQSPVEVFLKDKKEQGDGTSIIPCHVGERIYRARVSKKKHVINVSRVGSVENINLMAFKVAKSRQLEFIPVISANDPLIKEYRDTFDTSRISAPVVAESPIFLQEVREYAANNPEKTFVIMPETFFNDSPVVLKSFNDLRDAEKMIKEIKTAIEEKREKDARASIGSLREQAANLPEVIGKVIEQEVGILSKRIEEMDSPKKVGDDKPTIHEKGLSVIEKILDALINPSKVTLILILCIFMAYFPMVRASSVQKALTAPQAEKGSGRIVKTISSNQLKVRGNEVVLDMKDADVSRDLTGYVLEVIFKSGKSARLELLFKDSKWRNVYSYLMSPVNGVTRFDPAVDPRKVDKFKDFSNIKVVGIKSFTMNGKRLKSMIKGFRLIKGGTKAIAPEKGASVEKTSIRRSTIKPKISGGLDTGATASSMKRAMDVSMYGWKVQDYRDSRAIQSAGVDNKGQVWAEADLDANSSTISKGEVYIDFLYNMKRKIFDLRKTEITAWVYIPEELVNRKDPSNPNGIQLFLKDDKWENSYGTWCNVSASGWKKVQFIPLGNDKTDLSRIQILGVKIGAGGRSSFKGKGTIKIRDVKIKPVSWVPKLVADNPLDLPWRVQDYSDSQGFCSIKRTKKGLEISVDMKGGDPHKSKGEICLSLLGGVQLPGRSKGVQDLSNTKIVVTLEVSDGLVFRPFNGAHLASKSEDEKGRVRSQYGYWKNIVSPGEMTLTYTPTRAPQAPQEWDEEGFDPTRISELIIKLGTGGGSTFAFKGKIIVKSIKFEKAFFPKAPRLITTPYLREVPRKVTPISKKEFNKLSGASKYYSASTYGHDVGGSRGFRAREKEIEGHFRMLKKQGVEVVRLFTFCDLRNGAVRFDSSGKPTGYDPRVVDDLIALMCAADKAGIKLILPLFDFNLADNVSREGDTGIVGEHPTLLTNQEHKQALLKIFREILREVKGRMENEGLYDVVKAWEPMNEPELVNLIGQGIPSAMPYTQAFVTDVARLLRKVFPDKPVSLSTQKLEYLKYWIHLLEPDDIMQVHWYLHMLAKNGLDIPRGHLNLPDGVELKVIYGEVEPARIKESLEKIRNNGYDGALFWSDGTYIFTDSPEKLREFKEWFEGASLIIRKRINDIEKAVVIRASNLSRDKSGTVYLGGVWMLLVSMFSGKRKSEEERSQTEEMVLELQEIIKRTEQGRGTLTEGELKKVHDKARHDLVAVSNRILNSNDLKGLIGIFKKIHGKSNEAHWAFQELADEIAKRGGKSALYAAGYDLISGRDIVYKRKALIKAASEIHGIVENISRKDIDKTRHLVILERSRLKLQNIIDRMSKKGLTEKEQRDVFNDLINETDRIISSVDSADDFSIFFIHTKGENGLAHWVRGEFAKMIGYRGGIPALISTLDEVYGNDPASNDKSYVLALEISKLMKESEMTKEQSDKINQILADKIEDMVREYNVPEKERLILSDVIDVINENIRLQQDEERKTARQKKTLEKKADKIRQAVNNELLRSSLEDGEFCGIFLEEKGEMFYVIWNYQNERFELVGPELSEFIKDGFIYTTKNTSSGVSKENVKLYVSGEDKPRDGAICIYRLADSTNKIKVDSKFSIISAEKFDTLYANSAVREVLIDIRSASMENVIPRNVLINVDLFKGKDDSGRVMKAILKTIALKQKRLNRIFGKDVIGFEFVSLSGKNEDLKNELEIDYKEFAGITAERSRSKDPMEGFVITDIEDGQNYDNHYVLPLQGKIGLEYGEEFYNMSAIVDLAVGLTLLIDSKDTEKSHERVKALYERLNSAAVGEINLSLLLKQYSGEYKDLFKAIAIHPAANLSYEELVSMHEHVSDVLKNA